VHLNTLTLPLMPNRVILCSTYCRIGVREPRWGQGASFGDRAMVISSAATAVPDRDEANPPTSAAPSERPGASPACRVLAADRAGRSATRGAMGIVQPAARAPQNPLKSDSSGWRISAAFSEGVGESQTGPEPLGCGARFPPSLSTPAARRRTGKPPRTRTRVAPVRRENF
jgi:hypothetical protein